ncbi:MAG: MFS transporter [Tannerellaceae bacterium]|nr:MFS transporter [Tannerellaceae bacterium]
MEKPVLWRVSVIFSGVGLLLTSLILIALPVLITQRLGFAPDTANRLYGYALGVVAGGAIVGGILAGVLAAKLKPQTIPFILIGCAFAVLAGGVALQLLTNPMFIYVVLIAGAGLLVALSTLFQIQLMSYIQLLTPKELVGKVISFVICICMCLLPVGQFIYDFVFEMTGHAAYIPFYVAGATMLAVTLFTRPVFAGIETSIISA